MLYALCLHENSVSAYRKLPMLLCSSRYDTEREGRSGEREGRVGKTEMGGGRERGGREQGEGGGNRGESKGHLHVKH